MRFSGVLRGRSIVVPFDVVEAFGEARPRVQGTLNGTAFTSRLSVYGGTTYLGLRNDQRAAAGLADGDEVAVELERDEKPRSVEVPAALAAALAAHPDAAAAFDALAFTHRREYARWVTDAKRETTRAIRVEKAIAMLAAGVKHP